VVVSQIVVLEMVVVITLLAVRVLQIAGVAVVVVELEMHPAELAALA
jgi:hypothetical protein